MDNQLIFTHTALLTDLKTYNTIVMPRNLFPGDARQIAGVWVPVFLFMQAIDGGMDTKDTTVRIRASILSFAKVHVRSIDE